jgi:hypothetical protein
MMAMTDAKPTLMKLKQHPAKETAKQDDFRQV